MSNGFRKQIYNTLNLKETDELVEIWETNDLVEWSELTFDVIREILQERLGEIPPQDEAVYEHIEQYTDDKDGDDEIPAEYEAAYDFEESGVKVEFGGLYDKEAFGGMLSQKQTIKTKLLGNSSKFYKGIISSQGIRFTSLHKLANISWSKIYRAKQADDLIILFAEYISPMVFPRKFFKSEVDWQQFRSWVDYYVPVSPKRSNLGMSNIFLRLHCPNCGKQISDADPVCPHCGLDLDAPIEKPELQALAQPYLEKAKKAVENGGNLKGAFSNCNKAIEYIPDSAEAYNLRGLILDSMGKADEAIIAYREAIRLDPDFADAKDNLAEIEAEYPDIQAFSNQRKNHWIKNLIIAVIICVSLLTITGVTIILYVFGRPFLTPKQTVIFEPDRSRITTVTPADLKKTAEILTQRWRTLGYDSLWVSFTISDNGQIIGQIPTNINIELINHTKALGLVEFVDFGKTSFSDGTTVNTDFNSDYFPQVTGKKWHTIMTNAEMQTVTVQKNQHSKYEISFVLTEKGTKIFADYSAQNIGSYLGIIMDKVVVTCPQINGVIRDGNGVITGQYTQESAQELAAFLQTSPLPVPLK